MSEPSAPRSDPAPPRSDPAPPRPVPGPPGPGPRPTADRFVALEQLPVAEHVAVFEDEHARLQRELGTIDQL